MSKSTKTDILIAIFTAALVSASLLGSKITTILGISVSIGIFAYPFTFLVTDIIEEVYGKKKGKNLIIAGFVTLVLLFVLVAVARILPPADRFKYNKEYNIIFGNSLRIIIASLVAFTLSQTHDIWAFQFWKIKTKGKFLWLRNNASTVVSQFVDTILFMFIAFYQITPKFDVAFLFSLIIPYWLFKVAFALFDTPLVYAGVRWLRKSKIKN